MKRCVICGGETWAIKRGTFCRPCQTLYDSKRERALGLIAAKVSTGKIPAARKFKCVDCGKQARAYDHRNYLKPDEVNPVCGGCNNRRGKATFDGIFSMPKREHYNTEKLFNKHVKLYESWISQIYRAPEFLLGLERIDGVELHRSRK